VSLDIHTARYKPLRGDTYVKLPKYLASKKALINMKFRNENKTDNQCFKSGVGNLLLVMGQMSSVQLFGGPEFSLIL